MIGIICALKIEVDGLKALMENAEATKKLDLNLSAEKFLTRTLCFWSAASARSTPQSAPRL